jgi:hypothetical protein
MVFIPSPTNNNNQDLNISVVGSTDTPTAVDTNTPSSSSRVHPQVNQTAPVVKRNNNNKANQKNNNKANQNKKKPGRQSKPQNALGEATKMMRKFKQMEKTLKLVKKLFGQCLVKK